MCNFLFRNIFDNLIFKYLPFQIMIKIYKNCKIGEKGKFIFKSNNYRFTD